NIVVSAVSLPSADIPFIQIRSLLESLTFVESRFRQWTIQNGEIVLLRSPTNAFGITQLTQSAVQQIAEWIVRYKGGIIRYEKMLENLKPVHDEFFSKYRGAQSEQEKRDLVKQLCDKIRNSKQFVGLNVFYALAYWQHMQPISLIDDIIPAIADIAQEFVVPQDSGPGAFKPAGFAAARSQFYVEYTRYKLLCHKNVVGRRTVQVLMETSAKNYDAAALLGIKTLEQFQIEKLAEYISTRAKKDKKFNQYIGYSYAVCWLNVIRHLRLEKDTSTDRWELRDHPDANDNGFDTILATAALYNGGWKTVRDSLERYGPQWYRNMVGVTKDNPREPINYIRRVLEYQLMDSPAVLTESYQLSRELIKERYQRLIIRPGVWPTEFFELDKNSASGVYRDVSRTDNFNYELAAALAEILGSDYVDPYIYSYGVTGWADKLFQENIQTTVGLLAQRLGPGVLLYRPVNADTQLRQLLHKAGYQEMLSAMDQLISPQSPAVVQDDSPAQSRPAAIVGGAETRWPALIGAGVALLAVGSVIGWRMSRDNKSVSMFAPRQQSLFLRGLQVLRRLLTGRSGTRAIRQVNSPGTNPAPDADYGKKITVGGLFRRTPIIPDEITRFSQKNIRRILYNQPGQGSIIPVPVDGRKINMSANFLNVSI
ncbi:MAG: hypothetical protein NC924_09575, partial [Candidatus Omnitrophica bacterium]|nr:hypothetical protein [Candidatus Omnitrophota bacterium]